MKKINKKVLWIIISAIVAVTLISVLTVYFITRNNRSLVVPEQQEIIISHYDYTLDNPLIKEIKLTNKNDVEYIKEKVYSEPKAEDVEETILAEVIIDLKDENKLYIQLSNEQYAYIENDTKKEGKIIKMPEGLLEFINEKLK